jgi:hypothetical protein
MSQALIVICSGPEKDSEGKMSGTFDAGKSALKMGIPLFVLSPQILNPPPEGNGQLISLGGISLSSSGELISYLENLERIESSPGKHDASVPESRNDRKNGAQLGLDF